MRLAIAILALLLGGCAGAAPTTAIRSLDERPVTKACLTDPPPATDTFNTGMCKTLLSIDEEARDRERERSRLERAQVERSRVEKARLNQLRAPKSESTSESILKEDKRAERARLKELSEIVLRRRQQYIAAKRPVFRLKFRHEYPSMSEEEIEVLVKDAVEEGLREAMQKERESLFDEPVIRPSLRPPINCTSSQMGSYTYTDCY